MRRPQIKDNLALPSSQCEPTALYRRPLAASTLPPCLAAPWPEKNKRTSVEEEIKNKKCECKESTWDADGKELKKKKSLLRTDVRDPLSVELQTFSTAVHFGLSPQV